MHDCREFQEQIWMWVEGGDFPSDLEETTINCPDCARELALARSATEGFDIIRAVKAPHVAHVVAPRRAVLRTWPKVAVAAGAAAIVLLALLALQRFDLTPDDPKPTSIVAHHPAPTERISPPQSPMVAEQVTPTEEHAVIPARIKQPRSQKMTRQNARPARPAKGDAREHSAAFASTQVNQKECATESLSFPIEYRVDETRNALALAVKSEGGYIITLVPEMQVSAGAR